MRPNAAGLMSEYSVENRPDGERMGKVGNRLMRLLRSLLPHSESRSRRRVAAWQAEPLEQRQLLTIDIAFDYSYDTSGFFNPQARRDVLEAVAAIFEARLNDDLLAINPGGVNTWSARFNHPSDGSQQVVNNLQVPADTLIVYVGAQNLGSGLAVGGPGGFNVSGTQSFVDNLISRGESGVDIDGNNDTDLAPWGGTISFSTNTTWNFTMNEPANGQNDLYSVAVHELGHVLGFGTTQSYHNLVDANVRLNGPNVVAEYGEPVPLTGHDNAHFQTGISSFLPGTSVMQETAFDPQITTGTRKHLTTLDWGALDDIGWDVAPVVDRDFGDAPDATDGTGTGNYQTRSADNGPAHNVVPGLSIGALVDGDSGLLHDSTATADNQSGQSDEDFDMSHVLGIVETGVPQIPVNVTNTTGTEATLYGWIDYDGNGVFEAGESTSVAVPSGLTNQFVTLTFPVVPENGLSQTFARFRLSTDANAAQPIGLATDGEVEDHAVTVYSVARGFDNLPLFTWTTGQNDVRYELEVNNVTTGQDGYIRQTDLQLNRFRPQQALDVGTYVWRFRTWDGTQYLPWSSQLPLHIFDAAGTTPEITDPVASSIDSLPTLSWWHLSAATHYELWVDSGTSDGLIHQRNLKHPSFTPGKGLAAGSYTAWVRAHDDSGPLGDWSRPFGFVIHESGAPKLTEPRAGSTTTAPVFGWLPTADEFITLRITNLNTNSLVYEQTGLTGTSWALAESLPSGRYSATIQGSQTGVSEAVPFQVLAVSDQAELNGPNADSENPLPVFQWTRVAGALSYELVIDDVTGDAGQVVFQTDLTQTAYAIRTPLPPGTYRARVRALGLTGPIGTWSEPKDHRVQYSKSLSIYGPTSAGDNSAPEVVWNLLPNATHYAVSFAHADSGTGPLPPDQTNVALNRVQITDALASGVYQVTVTAMSGQEVVASKTQRFEVVPSSADPVTVFGPLGRQTSSRPVIRLSDVEGATRYSFWIRDETRGINAAVVQLDMESPVFVPFEAFEPGDYTIWGRAWTVAGPGAWSEPQPFSIVESAGVPVISETLHVTTSSVPEISWGNTAGAATYDIRFDALSANQNDFLTASGLTSPLYRPTVGLSPGDYRVRVRSVDGQGTPSAWSSDWILTVNAETVATVNSPRKDELLGAGTVMFAWSTVTDAVRYELWVDNLSTGDRAVVNETQLTGNHHLVHTLAAGTYRVWVRAILANGTGVWSTGRGFQIV